MERAKEIQTIEGRQAYELYKVWLEKQKRGAPPIETFCSSSYYTAFLKFAIWVRETGIPKPDKYVEMMIKEKISPTLWRRSEAYAIYLEYHDKLSSPLDQAAITIDIIQSLAEGLECHPSAVFSSFKVGEILELIQQRRLSPWLLFCSRSFKGWVSTLDTQDRKYLMNGIGVDYWAMKLESAPEVVKNLRELAESLGI